MAASGKLSFRPHFKTHQSAEIGSWFRDFGVTRITVSSRESADGLDLIVEDNGIGIPLDEKEKIFERGYGKNIGYGLFMAREILAITELTIQENGEPGKGARYEIHVPKRFYRFI